MYSLLVSLMPVLGGGGGGGGGGGVSDIFNTVPIFNSCTKCMDSLGMIHDRMLDCHPISRAWMHG